MLVIFLMAFFGYKNYKLAQVKGLPPWRWTIRTILWWLALDIAGMMIYINVTDIDPTDLTALLNDSTEVILTTSTRVLSGYLGYLLVKKQLMRKG